MRWAGPRSSRQGRPPWRIGVLDSDADSRAEVTRLIESRGATVVMDGPPGPDSAALLRYMKPDVVVLAADGAMPSGGALQSLITPDLPSPVVLVSDPTTAPSFEAGRLEGVMGVLLKPLRPEDLRPTLEVAIARFRDLRRLRRILADRPVVEQAKARLMSRDGLSESAAFGWLRRRAMDQRMRMGEVARAVLARDT
jgi:AmiR/NasT family two-component response regulator